MHRHPTTNRAAAASLSRLASSHEPLLGANSQTSAAATAGTMQKAARLGYSGPKIRKVHGHTPCKTMATEPAKAIQGRRWKAVRINKNRHRGYTTLANRKFTAFRATVVGAPVIPMAMATRQCHPEG